MKKYTFLLLFALTAWAAGATTTERQRFVTETFGYSGTAAAASAYTGYITAGIKLTGSAATVVVNTTSANVFNSYTGASVTNNVLIPSGQNLVVSGVGAALFTSIELQLGWRKTATTSVTLTVEYSTDGGTTWTALGTDVNSATTAGWKNLDVPIVVPAPQAADLSLRFTADGEVRLDDIQLSGIPIAATSAAPADVAPGAFSAKWNAVPNANKLLLEVAKADQFAPVTMVAGWTNSAVNGAGTATGLGTAVATPNPTLTPNEGSDINKANATLT
ncbi:MAG: hypothetical protein LBS63_00665, partial [Prevotellaceae bacterium]|nr:hypothetical protein [Prevotellaceae bacterium]